MLNTRISTIRSRGVIGFGFFFLSVCIAWGIGITIVGDDIRTITYAALILAGSIVAIAALRNWRTGFYMFFVWMMFEDFVRKYMGNGLVLFFGKDILLALVYLSFFLAVRKGREKIFRPPFLLFLSLFFWLGILQVFNQNSPSIWYGLLGVKVYFYYVPLLFLGYALVRNDEELGKFLKANALVAIVISFIGIMQAILGNSFLNPSTLAPELQELGNLQKSTMITGEAFNLPDSVFVSAGRYSEYLAIAFIVTMGAVGYLLLHTRRSRKWMFASIGLLGVATLLSGNRGSFVSMLLTTAFLSMGFLWGAPWMRQQVHRTIKAIGRSALVAALGLGVLFVFFPQEAGSRLEYYTETLLPSSANYQLGFRTWDYPVTNFMSAFSQPNWAIGNGIGTASLGTQYVVKLTGAPSAPIGVEEGYGNLMVEMGVLAPFLWILWSGFLLYYSWKVIRSLRETRLFPIALAFGWYAFVLLYLWTFASIAGYQNYTCNVFLWLLVGMLFRLPELLNAPGPSTVHSVRRHTLDWLQFRGGVQTAK
jgi:hypothetical protein